MRRVEVMHQRLDVVPQLGEVWGENETVSLSGSLDVVNRLARFVKTRFWRGDGYERGRIERDGTLTTS
jgi:hypothetical protein